MKKSTSARLFTFFRYFIKFILVYLYFALFILLGLFLFNELFLKRSSEIVSLTYYGFAIFAALSNICFSYSRTFDDNSSDQKLIRRIGERFLFATVGFLIGSLLNYAKTKTSKLLDPGNDANIFYWTTKIMSGIFFITSFLIAGYTIYRILDLLFDKIYGYLQSSLTNHAH